MRVVADSHAIVWYLQGSPRLSEPAASALSEAEGSDGIVVSVATLIDLWYVTQTTLGVTTEDLATLRATMVASPKVDLHPIDVAVTDAAISIPRDALGDPGECIYLVDFDDHQDVRVPERYLRPALIDEGV